MTRKRFVKLMMALGYSRNEANSLAACANRYGVSYADRWAYENSLAGGMERASRGLVKAFEKFGKKIKKHAVRAIKKLSKACEELLVGIDLANGPDVAAEITVAGGAENAD